MNNVQIVLFVFLTAKTIVQIIHPQKTEVLIFQWFVLLFIQQIFDLLGFFNFFYWVCLIAQLTFTFLKFQHLNYCAVYLQNIQIDKVLTEMRYQMSYILVTTTSKIFKLVFVKILQSIDNQQLNDERQSRLQQQLLDVSQFIEIETQNRCNKSQLNYTQIMDQTLNLNYTIIEKCDDLPSQQNRENVEILKELNATTKKVEQVKHQINVQPIAQQVQPKKPPQEQLKQSLQIQNTIQNQITNQNSNNIQNQNIVQNQNSIQKSKSPEQMKSSRASTDLNSLRKTLDLLQTDEKISQRIVVEALQEKVQESKANPSKHELFQKMQKCKEKILQQQKQNSNFYE
ncbi:unnamed protein product [Paramecium octaurelia]|uniref:Transmembrane protein n=1 Tax=Paramecium octaurelia TaxID=43137 RepID=A0A8S1UD19_PAROT|nr:unnamed protein product [Paramecium octaurelia]